jgi:soluble lytic murein transglycosylase-like protein
MNRVQNAIIPGTALGCILIILAINTITSNTLTINLNVASSQRTLNQAYPQSILQWEKWIEYYAQENGLDTNLVAAVMLQESGGDSNAYSSSGAVGLMQVMPRDGLAEAFMCNGSPCFASRPTMQELYDPEFNINYACRYLAYLIQHYGSIRDALKSYGPMDVGYRYADIVLSIYENHS